jgi:hypothetical protein
MRRRDTLPDPEVVHGLRELESALAADPTADPDLAQLVADVDAARPEPSAAFLASLDARVHAGFPREADAPRRRAGVARAPWHVALRRPQVLVPAAGCALAAGVVALAISTAGGPRSAGSASSSARGSATVEAFAQGSLNSARPPSAKDAAPHPTAALQTASGAATAKAAPSTPTLPSTADAPARKVERAADLTLTPSPEAVQDTADGVVRETQAAGGYVQRSDIATRDGGGDASFTLRIPSARLDDTLARLSKLAHVGALSQSATDITGQTASAATRLGDARAERRALLTALGRATTDRQIASLKARLADNRAQIAQRTGELDAQRRRADLATVAVTVHGTGTAKKGGGAWTPRDALHDAGRVLEVAGGVALIGLAVLAPLAVLALLALLAGRSVRRHRRETALDRSI